MDDPPNRSNGKTCHFKVQTHIPLNLHLVQSMSTMIFIWFAECSFWSQSFQTSLHFICQILTVILTGKSAWTMKASTVTYSLIFSTIDAKLLIFFHSCHQIVISFYLTTTSEYHLQCFLICFQPRMRILLLTQLHFWWWCKSELWFDYALNLFSMHFYGIQDVFPLVEKDIEC